MPINRIAPAVLRTALVASLVLAGNGAAAATAQAAEAAAAHDEAARADETRLAGTDAETSAASPAGDTVSTVPEADANAETTHDASGSTDDARETGIASDNAASRDASGLSATAGSTATEEDAPSEPATAPTNQEAPTADEAATDDDADAATDASSITLVRDGAREPFAALGEAVAAARTGDVIELTGRIVIDEPIVVDAGRALTLRATGTATIVRGAAFPLEGGKAAGMFRLADGAALTLESADPAAGELVIDNERTDSNDSVVTLRGQSTFTMRAGTAIEGAQCSWKPWGAVYVREGTFVLDGGELRNGFAMRNAAVAVERGSTFEMRAGAITGNRTSYSESIVWTKGTIRMTGGTIAGNASNVSSDGVVHVLEGGALSFTGGTIGNNNPNNTFGVRVDARGSLELGESARFEGTDRVNLAHGAALSFASAPETHTTDDPIEIVLAGEWPAGVVVATSTSPEVARAALGRLAVSRAGTPERTASVGIDAADQSRIALASAEVAALFDLLDHPFADNLGLELRGELTETGAFDALRQAVEDHFSGIDTPEKRVRLQQLEDIGRYASYLAANHDELAGTVRTLSQLGDPWAEAQRTKQGYQFDNLDATGLYLKPGQVNEIVVYVDADDPSELSVAWRQVGVTDTSNYPSLNLGQKSGLVNGANRITVDLTGKTYGSMLYLRNDSAENAARVRIESADAAEVALDATGGGAADAGASAGTAVNADTETGSSPALGTSLGAHPFYEHDPAHPERFWTFVQDIRAYAAQAQAGQVADMTLLQMGDEGSAQFAVSATAMARAYAGISSEADAVAYIEKSNKAIQDRLEFYWAFDGFDAAEANGPNAITTARVHTAFTRTVSNPSTMYAYGRYFHMPESSAASFLSGESMYGWGMSHEYGHMLDNNVIAVAEETNNLYSIAGARHGGIESARAAGTAFDPSAHYHVNAVSATKRRDAELAQMAADPSYVPDWMNGDVWGTYIWTHVTTWWNGLHFFDDWDYAGYDFSASPYTREIAADVKTYGAYGATLRILRGDAAAVKTIEDLASNASTGVKYNRMAVAFTMGTGYNFAEYLYSLGERDLAPEVLEWCAQYPSMPRKVQYFSLDTDAQIINGARTYREVVGTDGTFEPEMAIAIVGDALRVTASMPSDELARATTAWELYQNGQLVGFSRDGVFELTGDAGDGDPASFSVVAYDVRLNPSTAFAGDAAGEEPGDDGNGDPGTGGDGGEVVPPDNGDSDGEGETTPPDDDGEVTPPGDGDGESDGGDEPPAGGGTGEGPGDSDEQPPSDGVGDSDGPDEQPPADGSGGGSGGTGGGSDDSGGAGGEDSPDEGTESEPDSDEDGNGSGGNENGGSDGDPDGSGNEESGPGNDAGDDAEPDTTPDGDEASEHPGPDGADGGGETPANSPSPQADATAGDRATPLAATGDHSPWAALVAAVGGGIAIAGGVLAARFRRKR